MYPNYNYNYNYPQQQFNTYGSAQNFANFNYNPAQTYHQQYQQQYQYQHYQQQQQQYQQIHPQIPPYSPNDPNVIDIGTYTAPSLADPEDKWATTEDIEASYQRGSTVVRQTNNSTIDDYYKKFTRPITEYVPIDIKGQPTYVYQDLGATNNNTANKPIASQGR